MKIFGYHLTFSKAQPPPLDPLPQALDWTSRWWPVVQEPFTGAWQRNQELRIPGLLSHHAIYRCITMIAQDIAKMRIKLVENRVADIWVAITSAAFSPVLRKPNDYQTRIQFFEDWLRSKLMNGNTYVLKGRDDRNVVTKLYVLNPLRCKALVAPDGSVFYQLQEDLLAEINESEIAVPASEIIHDRYMPLYHPLCGVPPLAACALAGMLGVSIQRSSAKFFQNSSMPGGILTSPQEIDSKQAREFKEHWEQNYSGENRGRTAVLGGGLKYEAVARETAVDAQLAEQLKLSAEIVCTAFGVPPYMIGAGTPPNFNNIEALNQQYYSQCLQILVESIEILLDEGLAVPDNRGTEFCVGDLLRMDTSTKVKSWSDLVKGGIASPNEGRAAFDMLPVEGGESPYLQQQNYSLEALAKRDAKEDPFATASAKPPATDPAANDTTDDPAPEDTTNVEQSLEDFGQRWFRKSRQYLSHPSI